jgi:hypothetical protein
MCPAYYLAVWLPGCPKIKRPAARESPKAMEPPAVSRVLYQGDYSEQKAKVKSEDYLLKKWSRLTPSYPPPSRQQRLKTTSRSTRTGIISP